MIKCDNNACETQWYHIKCVGLLNLPAKEESWYCRDCSMEKTLLTANDELKKSKETIDLTSSTEEVKPKVSFADSPIIKPIPKVSIIKQPIPKQPITKRKVKLKKKNDIKLSISFIDGDSSLIYRNLKKRKFVR